MIKNVVCNGCKTTVSEHNARMEDWVLNGFKKDHKFDVLCPPCIGQEIIKILSRVQSIFPEKSFYQILKDLGLQPGNIDHSTNHAIYSMVLSNYKKLIKYGREEVHKRNKKKSS